LLKAAPINAGVTSKIAATIYEAPSISNLSTISPNSANGGFVFNY